eukprot:GHVR01111682.1.p1 GENE.GHVR01111682.1~~GHVR01111682.1.p1  ORF type:complete len:329 (-),score=-31.56 GHVR01111682.1:74-1060(-)
MDEEFHYRQFLYFDQNDFTTWDPKITTPPGLYYIQKVLSGVFGSSLATLRTINALLFGNLLAVFVLKIYEFQDNGINNISRTFNLIITPTIFFFNFLDYTDPASIALIVMAYYYNLVNSQWRLSLCSLLAIYVRQNNIIWILYLMIYKVLNEYNKQINVPRSFFNHFFNIIKIVFNHKVQIIIQQKLQFLVLISVWLYLKYYNEGNFVFGDHQSHKLTFHPTQLMYLSVFCFINIPLNIKEYISTSYNMVQKIYYSRHALASYLLILSISIVIVDQFSFVHKFILSDNRHYTFYLYRLIFKSYSLRLLGCLVYPLCFTFLFKTIVHSE